MLESLMEQLTKDLDIEESLATEFPGVFALPIDENVIITISALEQLGVTLKCDFTPCPEGSQEELFKELLQANLFGQGTHGAVLGLNEEKKMLTLVKDIPEISDYQMFNDILEDFMNSVDFWRAETKTTFKGS